MLTDQASAFYVILYNKDVFSTHLYSTIGGIKFSIALLSLG